MTIYDYVSCKDNNLLSNQLGFGRMKFSLKTW